MMDITSGKRMTTMERESYATGNDLRRMYDRLRKRSLRQVHRGRLRLLDIRMPTVDEYERARHRAYTAGVRDALNAVYRNER